MRVIGICSLCGGEVVESVAMDGSDLSHCRGCNARPKRNPPTIPMEKLSPAASEAARRDMLNHLRQVEREGKWASQRRFGSVKTLCAPAPAPLNIPAFDVAGYDWTRSVPPGTTVCSG